MALGCTTGSKPTEEKVSSTIIQPKLRPILDFVHRMCGIEHLGVAVKYPAVSSGQCPVKSKTGFENERVVHSRPHCTVFTLASRNAQAGAAQAIECEAI